MLRSDISLETLNTRKAFHSELGIVFTHLSEGKVIGEMPIQPKFFAANGFVHAGSIVTFADSIAGFSSIAHLPEGASSFTTLEVKTNFIGAAREGTLEAEGFAEHLGRSTHVWRVEVRSKETKKKVATFSCTQLILYK